jgi:hypothetical protein
MARSTREIFEDHLRRMDEGDLEGDLTHNYAPDCVLLTTYGRFECHDGRRDCAAMLKRQIPNPEYTYVQRAVHGEIAFLEWTATGDGVRVRDGADSFLIVEGLVRVMTIHYTVEKM